MSASEGVPCPIAMEDPEPEVVERVMKKVAEREARKKAEMNARFCLILNKELDPSRLESRAWCTCGSCMTFKTVRENLCCQEALEAAGKKSEALEGLQEKVKEVGGCILQHPSFHKIVDAEMLRVHMHSLRYQKRTMKTPITDENRSLRYCAYRTFVFWAYGRLGMNRRYELPACVRGAIMQAFPSDSGDYTGFRGAAEVPCVNCDSDAWRDFAL
ncbi:hypothetical protein GCK32_008422 [Trichostrongylus colubriformis]|uniref:P2X purinoreceptor 7 intracellular domain-containing protein n=1 Tax=Trichostrongylus colubriformis TaxID=6319 RepID=A0AAN8IHC7_TRICO